MTASVAAIEQCWRELVRVGAALATELGHCLDRRRRPNSAPCSSSTTSSVRIAGRLLIDRPRRADSDRRARRAGRPQRHRQDHAVPRHRRRDRARARRRSSCRRAARIGRLAQEAPDGPESLIEVVLAADDGARAPPGRGRDRDAIRIASPKSRPGSPTSARMRRRRAPPRSSPASASRSRSGTPLLRVLRRLAHAGRARRRRCSPSPICCCSTSRPTISISKARCGCRSTSRAIRTPSIVISHDRDLLDTAVDWILHLEAGKLTLYRGGYSAFERQRRERQALDPKLANKQEAQRKHLQAFVDRFRAKATKARQAQSRAQAAGQARADRGDRHRRGAPDRHSRRRRSRCRRRSSRSTASRSATSRAARCCGGSSCASTTTTASRCSAPTATASPRW